MIKKNNKGFTLLELIISISVLTIVISLGYRVINKYTIDVKNQGNINKGQLTINDMNEYLTKDLEQASSVVISSKYLAETNLLTEDSTQEKKITNENLKDAFVNYSGDNTFDYSYNINYKENNFSVIYEVNITKKDENNYNYTIERTDEKSGISIIFINNGIIKELQLPFEISLESPYKVYLGYNGKNNKFEKYEFTVASRLYSGVGDITEGSDDIIPPNIPTEIAPEIPSIPEDMDKKNTTAIGYWMLDASRPDSRKINNLYAWVEGKGEYGTQDDNNKEKFHIRGDNANGNGKNANAYMSNFNDSKNLIEINGETSRASEIYKIKIYVHEHTTLENVKVSMTHSTFKGIVDVKTSTEVSGEKNGNTYTYTLQGNDAGKWYEVKFELGPNKKVNYVIEGDLSINKSKVESGYAMIVYGNKANEGTGDSEEGTGGSGEGTGDSEEGTGGSGEGTGGSSGETGGSNGGNNNLNGDIVFDFYQHQNLKDKVCINYKSNIQGLEYINGTNQNGIDNQSSPEMQIFYNESKMRITGIDCSGLADVYKSDFKNIIGIKFSVTEKVKMNILKLKFESDKGYKEYDLNVKLDQSNNTYILNFLDYLPENYSINDIKVLRLGWKFDFNQIQQNNDTAQIKIDLMYNK